MHQAFAWTQWKAIEVATLEHLLQFLVFKLHAQGSHEVDNSPPLSKALRPAVWQRVTENIFTHRSRKVENEDDIMVCQCKPPLDGSPGCGDNCLNRMLNQECNPVSIKPGHNAMRQTVQACPPDSRSARRNIVHVETNAATRSSPGVSMHSLRR